MPFQFTCPNGHLLSADERQGGQQCQCPECGIWLTIPGQSPNQLPDDLLAELPAPAAPDSLPLGIGGEPEIGGMVRPQILHIPCPQGHILETPLEMLETLVACPFCQKQFRLRFEDSAEYREQKEMQDEARFARSGKLWIRWAIGFAVLVLGGLIAIIVLTARH